MTQLKPVGNGDIQDRVTVDSIDPELARAVQLFDRIKQRGVTKPGRLDDEVKRLTERPWPGATCWSWGEREKWGDGPWAGEPDKVLWVDRASGLHCIARRGGSGAWCGYVALEATHPLHGKDYNDVHELLPDLEVHRGLTFAEPCDDDGGEGAICHQTGDDDRAWWLGFDCAHCDDFGGACELKDLADEQRGVVEPGYRIFRGSKSRAEVIADAERRYKTLKWVRLETENLARQLKAAA